MDKTKNLPAKEVRYQNAAEMQVILVLGFYILSEITSARNNKMTVEVTDQEIKFTIRIPAN